MQADGGVAAGEAAELVMDAVEETLDVVGDVENKAGEQMAHPAAEAHPREAVKGAQCSMEGATEPHVGMSSNAAGRQGKIRVRFKTPECRAGGSVCSVCRTGRQWTTTVGDIGQGGREQVLRGDGKEEAEGYDGGGGAKGAGRGTTKEVKCGV